MRNGRVSIGDDNFVFSSFGLCYLGAFQYVQYTLWFPRLFPGSSASVVVKRVAFDQIINTGMWYYPLFYMVQSCVMHGAVSLDLVASGLQRYRVNIATDMCNCWKLWVPAQLVNFSVVPVHLRVPYAAGVSFVWSCVLCAERAAWRHRTERCESLHRAGRRQIKH